MLHPPRSSFRLTLRATVFGGAGLLLSLGLTGFALGADPASAAGGITYFVSTSGGSPTCSAAANSHGAPFSTIQAALNCAATDATTAASPDSIFVAAGTYDEMDTIDANVNVYGAGASQTFVNSSATPVVAMGTQTVDLFGLTIEGGTCCETAGGGVENEGGFLTVTYDTFTGNSVAGSGGAIDNYQGTLVATHDTFTGNDGATGAGAIGNEGTATATDDTFSGNWGGDGGGGAIQNRSILTATDDTFTENVAAGNGGGAIWNSGSLTASNDTFSGNSGNYSGSPSGPGGAIWNDGTVTATDDTFSGNMTSAPLGGGGIYNTGGSVVLSNSVLAGNTPGADCVGTITDDGYNIDDDGSCGFSATGSLSDNPDTDLGTLQSNGGPTQTMAITPASSAFELVRSASCTVTTDQRGEPRPGVPGQNCDAGAFEYQAPRFLSRDAATFTTGRRGLFFIVAASSDGGTPTLTESGALPNFVTFTSDGYGIATLSGRPTSRTEGTYVITITATDDNGIAVTQEFTLTELDVGRCCRDTPSAWPR